jgi:5,10-methylene-tetrahydrofolate dehydrogenase/methenyl tetrahydrofolate cyclohydrolase
MACAGSPGLLKAEWVKEGAQVINVGTTFVKEKDALVSDFEGDLATKASRFSPVPGGVGPLSAPHLFKNVAEAAWALK